MVTGHMVEYQYGFKAPADREPPNQLEVELAAFLHDPPPEKGGLGKAEHFWNIVAILWGPKSAKPFVRHPWAEKMTAAACEHNYVGLSGSGSSGKCLAPETKVMMFDGSVKTASDIKTGDRLMGDDSKPRTVLSTNTGRSNMVRIVPAKGESWECNDDHILCLKRMWATKKSKSRVGMVEELSVKDYLAKSQTFKNHRGLYMVGVDFEPQPVEFDPKIYGLWLGDGTTGRPHFTSSDSETQVNEYITSYFTKLGYSVKRASYSGKCPTWMVSTGKWRDNPFRDFVIKSAFGACGTKRIRKEYLFNSREVRLGVLAGLIDSDGYPNGTYFEIACSLPELAEDIVFLSRSLGFKTSCRKRYVNCRGVICQSFRINIMGNVQEIPTFRKKCNTKKLRQNSDCVGFRVEQLGIGDWCGFTLDGNGRFLLHDFTVTHNTDWMAVWALVNWLCAPKDTLVFCTSTSLKESGKRIWGSVKAYYTAAQLEGVGKLVESLHAIRTNDGSGVFNDKEGIFCIAGEKKDEADAIGKLIGAKNRRVFLLADELPELTESILTAAKSNLALNPFFQLVGAGNFKSIYDPFGVFIKPKSGYSSITIDDEKWETDLGVCIRFDGLKSPNIIGGKDIWPIYDSKNLANHRKTLGENSAAFWRMCRSFLCPEGDANVLYSDSDFIAGRVEEQVIWMEPPTPVAAADPAFTNEGDNFAVVAGLYGKNQNGLDTLLITGHQYLHEDMDLTKRGEPGDIQRARQLMQLCVNLRVSPDNCGVDCSGPGGLAFGSILTAVWSSRFWPAKFGEAATTRRISEDDPKTCEEGYVNRVSELWGTGKLFIRAGQIKGIPQVIARELKARLYETVKGTSLKIKVESKRDMKKRVKFSPDYGDAFLILVDLCRERFGFTPGTMNGVPQVQRQTSRYLDRAVEAHDVYNPDLSYTNVEAA